MKYGFRTKEAREWPSMLLVATSFLCNSDCIHCPSAKSRRKNNYLGSSRSLMAWEVFQKIADEAKDYKTLFRFSSAGEPLLHPRAAEMIEYTKKIGLSNVSLTTNGSLLNGDLASRILKAGINTVEISIDGYTKVTYESIRRGLDFDAVKENTLRLIALRGKIHPQTLILVSIIDQPEVKDELNEAVKFWEKHADRVIVRRYLTFQGRLPEKSQRKPLLPPQTPCPFPWERMSVDPAGGLRFCVSDLTGISVVANIKDTTIHAVWTGQLFKAWRKKHLEGKWREIPMCRNCTDREFRSWDYNYFHALAKARERRAS